MFLAFSLKTSRTCTDMLSHENDAIKFSKTAKNTNCTCITCTIVPGLVKLWYFSPNQSAVDQKHEAKIAVELFYISFLILITFL